MNKFLLLILLSSIAFSTHLKAQLIPGDVNKAINQVYSLAPGNFGAYGTPTFSVTPATTCGGQAVLTVTWGAGASVRYVDLHGGLTYSNTVLTLGNAKVLKSSNVYKDTFKLSMGVYSISVYSDPYDDFVGNTGGTGLGVDSTIAGGVASANDQSRTGVFGVTLLPVNTNNLSTCTINNTNATNCTTADGTIIISGLAINTDYQVANLVNAVFSGNINSGPSGTITISSLLTGIYPVKIRRSGETCYRQFNIKVSNNSGVECFADNQLIDASFGSTLINGGDFGVATGRLPRNLANTVGTGITDYTAVAFNASDPQDSKYALEDTTDLRANGFGSNTYTWRLKKFQYASQYTHLWATMQRTGDHTGSLNQNSGNTGAGLGYMMLVNANYNSDRVLDVNTISLTKGQNYYFSFWGKNIQPFMAKNKNNGTSLAQTYQPIIPRVALAVNGIIYDFADMKAVLEPASYTGADTALVGMGWEQYNLRFVAPVTNANSNITIYNFQTGGFGNDFAIDDLEFLALSVIGDRVWNDLNKDGIQDTNEPGMANVVATLYDDNGIIQTTVSDAFGYYQFANIAPAGGAGTNYRVKFTLPASYVFTTKNAPSSTVDTDSDVNTTGANFGITNLFNLTTGNSRINIDCGLVFDQPLLPASIGNIVWLDTNNDGIQNNNESGLANVTITLYNNSGTAIRTTVTDASGAYRFDNVTPGNYRVGITQPTGTICTGKDLGGDDNLDSDVNTTGVNIRKTDIFTIIANQQITNVDFGIAIMPSNSSSFGDFCWQDLLINGLQDIDEPGLPNVKVVIINPGADNIRFTGDDVRIDSTFTDAFGKWQFTNLTGTRYFVVFTPPSGYSYTLKNQGFDETVDSDIDGTGVSDIIYISNSPYGFNYPFLDVGFTITPPMPTAGSIGNYFWDDINGNGIQEASEFGVPGITVDLLDNVDAIIQTTTTNLDGYYKFPYVNPASGYKVKFSNIPPGFQFTLKDQGTATTDSDIDLNTGISNSFTLASNQVMDSIDGGIRQVLHNGNSSIGSIVWYDFNNNGIQDLTETGVPDIIVTLRNLGPNGVVDLFAGDDILYTTTTNALGQFIFNGLPQGTYRVEIAYTNTNLNLATLDQGGNDNKDSDGNVGLTIITLSTSFTDNFRVLFGEDKLNIGFGLVPKSTVNIIGNRVWKDKNSNGKQDVTGEDEGVQGVVVQLLNSTGTALVDADGVTTGIQPYQTTTDQYGYWNIVGAPDGTYIPRFALLPPGYIVTSHKIGANTEDSDILGNGRSSVSVAVGAGTRVYNDIDLGLVPQSAVLGDFVWDDLNGNGVQDAGEPGIGSATATLYNSANVALGSAVTDASGKYYFPNTPAGTYYLKYSNYPTGMQFTIPEATPYITNGSNVNPTTQRTNNYTISSFGDSLHIDAGLRVLNTANVGNFVWADKNANGIQEPATERPLSGIVVRLRNAGPDAIANNGDDYTLGTTITDGVGFYQFIITPSGNNYYLAFSNIPSGASFTTQNVGGVGASNNSKVDPSTAITPMFNLLYGATNQIQDAGVINITILPVKFEFFTAEKVNASALLTWKTDNENSICNYEVLHSMDGANFTKISSVTNNGTSTANKYLHTNPATGVNYYRINTINAFGEKQLSEIKQVKFEQRNIVSIYPNPVETRLYINIANTNALESINYTILDLNGKKIQTNEIKMMNLNNGINVSNLTPGNYYIIIKNKNEVLFSNNFLKK